MQIPSTSFKISPHDPGRIPWAWSSRPFVTSLLFFIELLFCPLLSWHSELQRKLFVHPWTLRTSTPLDPPEVGALQLKHLSQLVCLAKCWPSFRFQLGHSLPKNTFPASHTDLGPLLSDSPLPCAFPGHRRIRFSCHICLLASLSSSFPLCGWTEVDSPWSWGCSNLRSPHLPSVPSQGSGTLMVMLFVKNKIFGLSGTFYKSATVSSVGYAFTYVCQLLQSQGRSSRDGVTV